LFLKPVADLAVVVQAMSEHSLHTSLTGKTSDHSDLDGRALAWTSVSG